MKSLNTKYKFISNGTWFIEGTECTIDEQCTTTKKFLDSYDDLDKLNAELDKAPHGAIFQGKRCCNSVLSEGRTIGEIYDDEEFCDLSEFKIELR